jgi:FrmR/RcnR family transcriptional regulator, repressor of frmRAB operon
VAHTSKDREKLLTRVRGIRGQVDAIKRALESERGCSVVLYLMAACRGALNGLMAELIEGHVWFQVISPPSTSRSRIDRHSQGLFEQYRALVDWASRSREAGELLALPSEFRQHTLNPFR